MLVLRATVQVLRGWSSAPTVHGHLGYQGGMQAGMQGGQIPALGYGAMPGSMTLQQQQSALAIVPQQQPQQYLQPQGHNQGVCVCGGLPPHHHMPHHQAAAPPIPSYGGSFQQPSGAVLFTPAGPQVGQVGQQQQWNGNHSQFQAGSQIQQAAPAGYYSGNVHDSGSVASYQQQQQQLQHPGAGSPDPNASYLVYMSSPSPTA